MKSLKMEFLKKTVEKSLVKLDQQSCIFKVYIITMMFILSSTLFVNNNHIINIINYIVC